MGKVFGEIKKNFGFGLMRLPKIEDEIDLDEIYLKEISSAFCAGMGNLKGTCGALIGVLMILGAGGDLIIAALLLKTKASKDAIYLDHPTDLGLVMLDKNS